MRLKLLIIFFCLLFVPLSHSKEKQLKPLIELGMGIGYARFPDYPGADNYQDIVLPVPFVIYRGESLRADDEGGLRGRIFLAKDLELDVSFAGSFPADASENEAREGMEDLDLLIEVGPSLVWHINGLKPKNTETYKLKLPVRQVLSMSFWKTGDQGYVFNPKFLYQKHRFLGTNTTLYASYQMTWATSPLMDYFYKVEADEVLANRPEFDPKQGFLGSTTSLSLLFPIIGKSKKWIFVSARHSNYDSNENRLSPLLKSRDTYAFVLGFTYVFYESEQREKDLSSLRKLKF